MQQEFEKDILHCLEVLKGGGSVLYPTDTVWGIGCDATNAVAVQKIFQLKQREDSKALIVLVADERSILNYVAAPDPAIFDFLDEQKRPTTIVFEGALGLAPNLLGPDGSVAIRVAKDDFCRHLIKRFRKPIVSTSANISGQPTPAAFAGISNQIKQAVDYVVKWRREDAMNAQPSQIIKWNRDGSHTIIRS